MFNFKKPLYLTLLLLLVFAGCSSDVDNQLDESTDEPKIAEEEHLYEEEEEHLEEAYQFQEPDADNDEDGEETPPQIVAVKNTYPNFSSAWAKNDTHFFLVDAFYSADFPSGRFTLYGLPLDDISQGQEMHVPGEGMIEIVGIDEQYLYISIRSDQPGEQWAALRRYEFFRISLSTFEATLIYKGEYLGTSFLHLASNSIISISGDLDKGLMWLEYYRLDTSTQNIFYELELYGFDFGVNWVQMEDEAVVLIGGRHPILIDSELYAQHILLEEMYGFFWHGDHLVTPQNPAEEYVLELGRRYYSNWSFATVNDKVYYLWRDNHRYGDLYRMNIDGTESALLRDDYDFWELFNINDTLIATHNTGNGDGNAAWYRAILLSNEGDFLKALGSGFHGHNYILDVQQLPGTDMVMIVQLDYFKVDGRVVSLYNTATGAFFATQ